MKINNLQRAEFKETLKIKWKNDVARSKSHKLNWLDATLWLRSVHVIFLSSVHNTSIGVSEHDNTELSNPLCGFKSREFKSLKTINIYI